MYPKLSFSINKAQNAKCMKPHPLHVLSPVGEGIAPLPEGNARSQSMRENAWNGYGVTRPVTDPFSHNMPAPPPKGNAVTPYSPSPGKIPGHGV